MQKSGKVYLGVWFQRTALHLKEIYRFLKYKEGIKGLSHDILADNWNKLLMANPVYHEETNFDILTAKNGDIDFTMTEDGVILLSTDLKDKKKTVQKLAYYYSETLGPSIEYLFSLGAPIPKDLKIIEEAYPIYFILDNATKRECIDFFHDFNDKLLFELDDSNVGMYTGEKIHVINLKKKMNNFEELLRSVIFFREFEKQLNSYLASHRLIWDKLTEIRERRNVRYKDFGALLDSLLDYLKTISFGKARLDQMKDILDGREVSVSESTKRQLEMLGFLERFELLKSSHAYITHLWEMTSEYANSTKLMIESLNEESTHFELLFLNFVTVLSVVIMVIEFNYAWEGYFQRALMLLLTGFITIASYYVVTLFMKMKKYSVR